MLSCAICINQYIITHNLYINAAVVNTCTSCNAVTLTHVVDCNPPCANGTGVCVANNTCSCAPGYFGDTCSEQGKLHSTQLILQLYMYQLGLMLHLCHVRTYKYLWVCILTLIVCYMHCSLTHKLNWSPQTSSPVRSMFVRTVGRALRVWTWWYVTAQRGSQGSSARQVTHAAHTVHAVVLWQDETGIVVHAVVYWAQ